MLLSSIYICDRNVLQGVIFFSFRGDVYHNKHNNNIRPLVKSAYKENNFLISQPKHMAQLDGSFEHP